MYNLNNGFIQRSKTMKNLKTTLAVLGIVLSTAAFATTSGDKKVKVSSTESDKVQLTYRTAGKCRVKVNIYDAQGDKIFTESIINPKSFTKSYDISKLPSGEYQFEIIDRDEVRVEKIVKSAMPKATAEIIEEAEGKFKLVVLGELANPIAVNIYDGFGHLIFGDFVEINKSFSRVYDLSKVKYQDVSCEIIQDGTTLAKTEF